MPVLVDLIRNGPCDKIEREAIRLGGFDRAARLKLQASIRLAEDHAAIAMSNALAYIVVDPARAEANQRDADRLIDWLVGARAELEAMQDGGRGAKQAAE